LNQGHSDKNNACFGADRITGVLYILARFLDGFINESRNKYAKFLPSMTDTAFDKSYHQTEE